MESWHVCAWPIFFPDLNHWNGPSMQVYTWVISVVLSSVIASSFTQFLCFKCSSSRHSNWSQTHLKLIHKSQLSHFIRDTSLQSKLSEFHAQNLCLFLLFPSLCRTWWKKRIWSRCLMQWFHHAATQSWQQRSKFCHLLNSTPFTFRTPRWF